MFVRPCTVAKLTVPPANHGRVSFRRTGLRAMRQPTPVGVPEHLVEGDGDEVRVDGRQIESIRGNERCCVEQHVPAVAVRFVADLERVFHA